MSIYKLVLKLLANKNDRVRNLPEVTEIVAIFQSEDGEVPEDNVLLCSKTGKLKTLSHFSFLKDSATYLLFFPTGAFGWKEKKTYKKLNKELKQKNNKQIEDLLEDYLIDDEDNEEAAKKSKRIKLSNSYIGLKRIMHLGCQDVTIEFQKRSLPHIHIMVKFSKDDFRLTSNQVDGCVKSEYPDKEKSTSL
uniref:Helitron_like_N domain-containing protein n=1 Tax=Strongyloides venezuelensis TaxID=75913 RepID=A0A0K0FQL3_STRVS